MSFQVFGLPVSRGVAIGRAVLGTVALWDLDVALPAEQKGTHMSRFVAWLDALDARQRADTIEKIIQFRPLAMVISKGQPCPEDLRAAAEASDTPPWG